MLKRLLQLFLLSTSPLLAHFYTPERLAFPSLCEKHFNDTRNSAQTWIAPSEADRINEMTPYLKCLPRPYEADCYGCSGCGGMRLSRREEFHLPFENQTFAYSELTKLHQQVRYGTLETCRHRGQDRCETFCWDGGYFRRMNDKYFPFFKEYLVYCSQNPLCKCFWPERYQKAVAINNLAYRFLYSLAEQKLILNSFSSYWVSKEIRFDRKGRFYGKEYYPSSHGMASSLTSYLFFYSHYHQMLRDIVLSIETHALDPLQIIVARDQVYQTLEQLRAQFLLLYTHCLNIHPHPTIYFERSRLWMEAGEIDKAIQDLQEMIALSTTDNFRSYNLVTTSVYQRLGEAHASLGINEKALEAFSQALEMDPKNGEAQFLRAAAYFEMGNFEGAIADYLLSNKKEELLQVPCKTSADFKEALQTGMQSGIKEALPGVQKAFWVALEEGISSEALQLFANGCDEIGRAFFLGQQMLDNLPQEVQSLFSSYALLGDAEKGERIGYAIGKYGLSLFAQSQSIKQFEAFKRLQEANRLALFSAMVASEANRKSIIRMFTKAQPR
jgi:tetratricopeptide (TPR) repeat protein